jgi:hypothetical protein
MQNEPNSARAPGNGRGLAGCDVPPESDCAKQSQFVWGRRLAGGLATSRPGGGGGFETRPYEKEPGSTREKQM